MPDLHFLQGGGAMGERIRAFDWANHSLGPPEQWPGALRMAVGLCLSSSFPTAIYWGRELHLLYNDAWSVIPAEKHPRVLGLPASQAWDDIWPIVGPQFRRVLETGEGFAAYEQMLPMVRGGVARETWWNYSFTAIRHADGRIGGVFNQGNEITEVVHARRERQAEIDRWRELFRQAPAPVAWLRGPQHRFEFANEAYQQLVGGRALQGRTVTEALPEVAGQGFVDLLDGVYARNEPHVGHGVTVKLQRTPGAPLEERTVDFVYQPVLDIAGNVDGILVLVTDVTESHRAEAALRLSNWQLGEERARLASMVEAEQRARLALRRVSESLEAQVRQRTGELTQALHRLRATFDTQLLLQGFLDVEGRLLDANAASLQAIGQRLEDIVGRPFWDTPWFTGTPGMADRIRAAVATASGGETVRTRLELQLKDGPRRFEFSLRPAFNAQREVIGLVPEALESRG